jgi:DNA-binding protein WhiA
MSFSGEVKEELSRQTGNARHCQIAELAGVLLLCGTIHLSADDAPAIGLQTENIHAARKYAALLGRAFRIVPEVRVRRHGKRSVSYLLYVAEPEQAARVLQAVRLLSPEGGLEEDIPLVHSRVVRNSCCRRAFLRGAFLAAGSVSDPNRSYHFEIVCDGEYQAEQLKELIRSLSIDAKTVRRKKYSVVYVKEGAQIADLLGMMDARVALLKLENVRILKEMRGSVNRKVNCETANINKTVNAAVKQIEDIRYIRDTAGLSSLSNGLDEIARIRLQYPEATLKELGMLLHPAVGKSGVNHRLRKLSSIAEKLRESKEENYYD